MIQLFSICIYISVHIVHTPTTTTTNYIIYNNNKYAQLSAQTYAQYAQLL